MRKMILTIKSRSGKEYWKSDYNGSWWRRGNIRRPDDKFIGSELNLPKEILKKLRRDHRIDCVFKDKKYE